jgi:cell division protein FtsB
MTEPHNAQEKAETETNQQPPGLLDLKAEKDRLEIALQQTRGNLEQARKDSNELIESLRAQLTQVQQALEKEKKSAEQWAAEKQTETAQLAKIQQEKLDLTLAKVNSENQSAILEQEVKTQRRIRRLKLIMFVFGLLAFFTATLWAISAWVIRQEVTERQATDEQNTVLSQKVTELEADKQSLQARIAELAKPIPLATPTPTPSPSPSPSPLATPSPTPSPSKRPSPRPSPLKTPTKSHHPKKRSPSNRET